MIESIQISNYALIDSVEIEFQPGLNVITGETGAGKSIILGALSLILGGRADTRVIADSSRKSVIEAVFNIDDTDAIASICRENEIELDPADPRRLIMRRELSPSGRSRAFVNDSPVSLATMRSLAIHLVDIHSQHQNLLLAQPSFQLDIIDSLAGNAQLRDAFTERYIALRDVMRRLKRAKAYIAKTRQDEEFTRFQLAQLDELNLIEGEQDDLERERDIQASQSEIKSHLVAALQALQLSDSSALTLIGEASAEIEMLDGTIDEVDTLISRLDAVKVELQDIAEQLSITDRDITTLPTDLEAIDERLQEIRSMERRHQVDTVEQLIAIREKLRANLSTLDNADSTLERLEAALKIEHTRALEAAALLTESRRRQAAIFEADLKERAVPLGMKNLQCNIKVSPDALSATGADRVEFLFAFNKNQPMLPVGDTASGGEISRLMLSIKAIIAERMHLPSLILDEIDTGVSGDVAARMGLLMEAIAGYSQVITITHLPQVASKGVTHFKVYKEDDEHSTHTHIAHLDRDGRIDELAIMLSGDAANEAARLTAIKLLDN